MRFQFKARKDICTFDLNGLYSWWNKSLWCFKYGPAVIYFDGYQAYYLNGKLHREDGPAVTWDNGTQEYYLNGKRHREDGPAVIYFDGYQEYYLNGKRHREDGPAVI